MLKQTVRKPADAKKTGPGDTPNTPVPTAINPNNYFDLEDVRVHLVAAID